MSRFRRDQNRWKTTKSPISEKMDSTTHEGGSVRVTARWRTDNSFIITACSIRIRIPNHTARLLTFEIPSSSFPSKLAFSHPASTISREPFILNCSECRENSIFTIPFLLPRFLGRQESPPLSGGWNGENLLVYPNMTSMGRSSFSSTWIVA